MKSVIERLAAGKDVTIPTVEFRELRTQLNKTELGFKISAVVGKQITKLTKISKAK